MGNKKHEVKAADKATEPTGWERFQMQALHLGLLMDSARDYLMQVNQASTTTKVIVETTLEKLGFGKNGLESNFWPKSWFSEKRDGCGKDQEPDFKGLKTLRKAPGKTVLHIKDFVIQVTGSKQASHRYYGLPEDLCKKMCEVIDRGKQYSSDSRYIYICNGISASDLRFQFGTAKAAVQSVITMHFGEGVRYLLIAKL